MQLEQHFADRMGALLGPDFPSDIALAVSGGGDSMAMLHLAAGWARRFGVRLWPVTVDHGLRDGSADEARLVADEARGLGLSHETLRWDGWDGSGNLQDAARQARIDLIGGWAGAARPVLMAHTRDDQAETVLMRLMRGSGVDGLAGMRDRRDLPGGASVIRPLLEVRRSDLRRYLTVLRIPFVDDPGNDDPRFDRVKIRQTIAALGLDVERLARTADQMQRVGEALTVRAAQARAALRRVTPPFYATFDRDALARIEAETRLRLVADALMEVGGQAYRPRLSALETAVETALSGGQASLHGCLLVPQGADLHICREWQAVRGLVTRPGAVWDSRWHVNGPETPGAEVRALGAEGLAQRPGWRDAGHPRAALLASPAIWRGGDLLAAPLAGDKTGWSAQIVAESPLHGNAH